MSKDRESMCQGGRRRGMSGRRGPRGMWCRRRQRAPHDVGELHAMSKSCCFVLLIPTPEEYRVPRVNPGVTASKLFPPLLPSLATPGPPLPYRPLQNVPVLLSEVQSGVQHLLGLISGLRRGGRGIPISSLVVEMDLLPLLPSAGTGEERQLLNNLRRTVCAWCVMYSRVPGHRNHGF